jgi:hypothetical protein
MPVSLFKSLHVSPTPGKVHHCAENLKKLQSVMKKPVIGAYDFDKTAMPWLPKHVRDDQIKWEDKTIRHDELAFQRYLKTLHHFAADSDTVINTGRGIRGVQEVAPLMARIPFVALGLNDGQQLFVLPPLNQRQDPVQARRQWIESLTLDQLDQPWLEELSGWSTTQVLKDLRELMPARHFQQETGPGQASKHLGVTKSYVFTQPVVGGNSSKQDVWVVRLDPDQAYLEINRAGEKKATQEEIAAFTETLGHSLAEPLKKKWPNFSFHLTSFSERCFLHVAPENNNKASLINFLANQRAEVTPQAVISAGDTHNDVPLLSLNHLGGIPNYPIMVGDSVSLKQVLAQRNLRHLETVGWNELDKGIEKQFHKIKPGLASATATHEPKGTPGSRLDRVG